jgi:hypothetical protein
VLVDFEFTNFRSFRDTARMSLEAVTAFKEAPDNVIEDHGRHLLTSAAVYGPNAGGKSNLVKALFFMTRLVRLSAKESQADEPIPIEPFRLEVATESAPSRFQVRVLDRGELFRYGFEVDAKKVHTEWLFATDLRKERLRERALFLRDGDGFDVRSGVTDGKTLTTRTRENALFLSVAAQWNQPIARRVLATISRLRTLSGSFTKNLADLSFEMLKQPNARERLITAFGIADLGIENLTPLEREIDSGAIPTSLKKAFENRGNEKWMERLVLTEHRKFSGDEVVGKVSFDLDEDESEGSQTFFHLMGPVLSSLEHGYTLFVDELEAHLHPLLTREIVRMFRTPSLNTGKAQLVFCTYDTNLLAHGALRRDQIWFVEKSPQGASALYPLSDFKGVRKDSALGKEYFDGRFGAVPFFGGWTALERLLKE